jgi:chromate transporter
MARRRNAPPAVPAARTGSVLEVFLAFLRLGVSSFGGPIAHLGYFREELVVRRRWIDEPGYADLVALCQFLPGPASSQVGFSLGVLRGGGLLGGLAAWVGFTLPSALLLLAAALGAASFDSPLAHGILHGLKLVAVAVVAQAVWGMARSLAPDRPRAAIALGAITLAILPGGGAGQIAAIALGALAGLQFCQGPATPQSGHLAFPVPRQAAIGALLLFAAGLIIPPALAADGMHHGMSLFAAFYRAGALVFGGGHVVLPLLQAETVAPGWVSPDSFLAGYGLTQAVPGPLFTFAAYLGAVAGPAPNGVPGAAIALAGVFLPGLLLVYGMLPFWDSLRRHPSAQAAMRGANAAVVGILAMALYNPVWTGAVFTPTDFALAAGGFTLLTVWRVPPWVVVVLLAAAGGALI